MCRKKSQSKQTNTQAITSERFDYVSGYIYAYTKGVCCDARWLSGYISSWRRRYYTSHWHARHACYAETRVSRVVEDRRPDRWHGGNISRSLARNEKDASSTLCTGTERAARGRAMTRLWITFANSVRYIKLKIDWLIENESKWWWLALSSRAATWRYSATWETSYDKWHVTRGEPLPAAGDGERWWWPTACLQ